MGIEGIDTDIGLSSAALLILGFSYDWLFLGLQLNFIRNTLFSLMIGLYILSVILVVYSPETFPIKKKQEYLIEKYISKAKEMAIKYLIESNLTCNDSFIERKINKALDIAIKQAKKEVFRDIERYANECKKDIDKYFLSGIVRELKQKHLK